MRVLCALFMSLALVASTDPKAAKNGAASGSEASVNIRFFGGSPSAHFPALVALGLGGLGSLGVLPPVGGLPFGHPGLGRPASGGVSSGIGGGGAHSGGSSSSGCRYWCKTPERQFYCCETNNQRPNPGATQVVKPGRCPPVRLGCPRTFGPPITCSNDGACDGVSKCCFDRCLEEHVCKDPLGYSR